MVWRGEEGVGLVLFFCVWFLVEMCRSEWGVFRFDLHGSLFSFDLWVDLAPLGVREREREREEIWGEEKGGKGTASSTSPPSSFR